MPDTIVAKSESNYILPPEGLHLAVCVDTIDLGEKVESFQNEPKKLVHKIAIVWQIDEMNEKGKPFEVSQEYTLSFGELAALRKLLTSWRGKSYTNDEVKNGVPLHKLVGVCCMLQVEHKTSGSGKTYAKVLSAMPVPKGMPKMEASAYTRWDGWAKRKAEYAQNAATFRSLSGSANGNGASDDEFEGFPPPLEDQDDDLPF